MSTRKRTFSSSCSPVAKSPRQEVIDLTENQTPVAVKPESSGGVCTADNKLGADASKREVIILVGYPSAGKTTLAR